MDHEAAAVAFQPGAELLQDRARAEEAVEVCLAKLRAGVLPTEAERQIVDVNCCSSM